MKEMDGRMLKLYSLLSDIEEAFDDLYHGFSIKKLEIDGKKIVIEFENGEKIVIKR